MHFPGEGRDPVIGFLIQQSSELELWRQGVFPEHPRVEHDSTKNAVPLPIRSKKLFFG